MKTAEEILLGELSTVSLSVGTNKPARIKSELWKDALNSDICIHIGRPKPVERICNNALFAASTILVIQESMVGLSSSQIYKKVVYKLRGRVHNGNSLIKFLIEYLKPTADLNCKLAEDFGVKMEIYADNSYQAIYRVI